MEGKRLFYNTKMCDATNCANNHASKIEQIEKHIITLFDSQLSDNNIVFAEPTRLLQATHIQYLDKRGKIHIRPRTETWVLSDIVNFRPLIVFPSIGSLEINEVNIGGLLEAYNKHLVKSR